MTQMQCCSAVGRSSSDRDRRGDGVAQTEQWKNFALTSSDGRGQAHGPRAAGTLRQVVGEAAAVLGAACPADGQLTDQPAKGFGHRLPWL